MGHNKRHFYVNERVKAMFTMALIMAVAIVVVFFGMETIRHLPNLTPHQKLFLAQLRYPFFLKILVMLDWGVIAMLSAYLVLEFQYQGFFLRFNGFMQDIIKEDRSQLFPFRNNDSPSVMSESFNGLLTNYRQELDETRAKLEKLKEELSINIH